MSSLVRRLWHDTRGQVLLLGIVVAVTLIIFMLAIPNGTHVVNKKMRAQTAADAGTFTGSVWVARVVNLNANTNIGIRSIYTWMTVLTVSSALAQALYSDTVEASATAMGEQLGLSLFGNSDPVYVSANVYPAAIERLVQTGRWLLDLQEAVAISFTEVAEASGWEQARHIAGGNPYPSGAVLVRTNDTLPMFVTDAVGDSLLLSDLNAVGSSLESLPTNDTNIGPATGVVNIDPNTFDVYAYYGYWSQWAWVRQVLKRYYQKPIIFEFRHNVTGAIDTGIEYFAKPGGKRYSLYNQGDSWPHWVSYCGEDGPHTPFIWPNGKPNPPYKNPLWTLINNPHPGNNRYKIDTVWVAKLHIPKGTPAYDSWSYTYPETGPLLDSSIPWVEDSGDVVDSSIIWTDFYNGADSTEGHTSGKMSPSRLNPDRTFHSVAYVFWDLGDSIAHRGLHPPLARAFFPAGRIAAPYPTLAVAQSEPYLAGSPTVADYFFNPEWDARLAPLDSTGVLDITNDSAYVVHLSTFNLEELRKRVLLP